MNATYFAIGCLLAVAIIFWGSTDPEPKRLAELFGMRPPKKPEPPKAPRRW